MQHCTQHFPAQQIIPTLKLFIMEMGKILSADVLDIIFDERNKAYGAYDLRKNYQRRLTKSLSVTILVVVLICLTYILLGSMKLHSDKLIVDGVINLEQVKPKEQPVEKIVPPPVKQVQPPAIRSIQFTKPLIVNVDPPENERPPEQETLETAKIGTINQNGRDDDNSITPPVSNETGVVSAPQKRDNGDETFRKVEIDAQYPGGTEAWRAFLFRRMVYPQEAIDERIQGTVYVQFVVDKEGNVSDVTAIIGPAELYAAAVNVIRKSGKWEPGIQNGQKVKSYKNQPVVFKLTDE